jgi:IstB-like ATP binding protein
MAHNNARQASAMPSGELDHHLRDLKLAFIAEHYGDLANQAAGKQWSHVDYLGRLIEGEAHLRRDRATHNRLRQARFPVIKTLDQFRWDWPAQINRLQVQHHFGLGFIKDKANLIYLGGVGLGKPQPCNYPCRSQRRTGTDHHRHRSSAPAVWPDPHARRDDTPCDTRPLLCGVAAAPHRTTGACASHQPRV